MRYREYKKVDIPWLDEVPSHWKIQRIASVFDIRKEKNDPIKTGEVLSLSAKYGVTPYSEKKEKGGNKPKSDLTKYNLCYQGDILVNCMNVVAGAVGISNYFGAVSPVYYPLVTNKYNNKYYMEYLFRNYDFQRGMVGLGKGIMMNESESGNLTTVRMRISWDTLKTLKIPIPPKEDQEQIAKFLDWKINYIDRLIENENKKIKIIKKSIKSAHKDLILGKLKNKSMNFTDKKFVDGIPSNWKVVKLKKVLNKIEIDANKDDEIVICSNHGYSFYRGEKKIGLSSEDNRYYQKVEKDQIMIHGMDTWHGAICISNHNGKCTRVVHVCESKQNNEYIVYYLRLLAFMGMYKPYSNGVRQNTSDFRSWNVLGNIDILLPPKTEQDSIVEKLSEYIRINKQTIKISEERLKLLELVKKSIISDVVTGKIDVSNIEIPKCKKDENIYINYDEEEIEEGV
ncbi:hypothetical protein ING2D1G_0223 [Peptoniphilus sp. ING2-D1G]|nr:hypothetical protein ING2D1G_0223 [Peptoniphilus sp. ING2-D1G]